MADGTSTHTDATHTDARYTTDDEPRQDSLYSKQSTSEIAMITGGSGAEILVGMGAIACAILGLVNVASIVTLSVAVIAVGCGLIMQGMTITGAFSTLLRQTSEGQIGNVTFGGGIGKEILGGMAGIGLGIASIVGLVPNILLPVAAIVLGATFISSSVTISHVNNLMVKHSGINAASKEVAGAAILDASGLEILAGLAAITLGIIELVTAGGAVAGAAGVGVATITLVAFLILAIATFLAGMSLSGRTLTSLSIRM